MDKSMLRKALWEFHRPLNQLITNILNPDIGEKWLVELKKFLRQEPCWMRNWYEKNKVIYATVTSDGTTGHEWIERLKAKGLDIPESLKKLLESKDFVPTKGIKTKIAILKGCLFIDELRDTIRVGWAAKKIQLTSPTVEVACIMCCEFSSNDIASMDLECIVAMHDSMDVYPDRCSMGVDKNRLNWFRRVAAACYPEKAGFAFVISKGEFSETEKFISEAGRWL